MNLVLFCPAVMAMKTGKVADVVVKHGNYYVYMLANPVLMMIIICWVSWCVWRI